VKRPIYQSVAINDVTVRQRPHDDAINLLRRCRTRRFASLTLMTSRDNDAQRDTPRKYTNNFAGFTDAHVVPKTIIHEVMIMYEASKSPAIMADATSCRKSKMAAS